MASLIDLAGMRERVKGMLEDLSNVTWSDDEVDGAIRLALARLSERRPREVTDSIDAEAREIDVSALNVVDGDGIVNVWFPYDDSDGNAEPTWVDFETFVYNDTLYLRLLNCDDPAPGDVARVVFFAPQTLNGLDGASATSFYGRDETLVAKGAAAFAFLQRSGGVSEEEAVMAVATPNEAALFATWMEEFEKGLMPRAAGVSAHPKFQVRS